MTEDSRGQNTSERPTSPSHSPSGDSRPPDEPEDKYVRRAFFVEGLRSLVKPVAHLLEKRLGEVKYSIETSQRLAGSNPSGGTSQGSLEVDRLIRPPGALEEELFFDRCSRSGQCVSACPVQAIRVLESEDPRKHGTPFIDPQTQACVVCEDLACMQACPTGALRKIPSHLINMGLAAVRQDLCLRTDGEDCQLCVEKCPVGTKAIEIPYHGAEVEVKTEGCVGCGVCEMYCPTSPRAIVVKPDL